MTFLIKTVISFIIGVVLAEVGSMLVPLALLVCMGILYFLPQTFEKYRSYTLFFAVSAVACVTALQDKNRLPSETIGEGRTVMCQRVCDRIDVLSISEESKAVAKGILLGDKDALNKTQKQSIREAGMSHIMAVSGLHIGIIYFVLFWLLSPMRFFGFLKLHRMIVIGVVWAYVYVIGSPISSVRAALMLSIAVASYVMKRDSNGLHIIASAALIMLLYNTQQLWEVGFQLSFLAALGIIQIQPLMRKKNRLVQMLMVTLSAQIITAPIVAYYFHIVPLFGWVQGLLVVPLLPILIYLLFFYLLFPSLSILALPIDLLVDWLFFVAKNIASLEEFCLGGKLLWYPTLPETCVMMAIVVSLYYLNKRCEKIVR